MEVKGLVALTKLPKEGRKEERKRGEKDEMKGIYVF